MLLKVEGLSLVSDGGIIIQHLSFTIDRGEIVALTGKSGSGKTSIGLAILGLLPSGISLQEGIISWLGTPGKEINYPNNAAGWSSLRGRQIGYIQQDVFGIFDPVLSMGDQMVMVVKECAQRGHFDIEAALRLKMAEVGIVDVNRIWNSYPHQLSGGQLQRCQICLCIVIQPQLLIADEPTSAIDKINQLDLLDLLAHVRNQYHMAILCITHEEAVVKYLADRRIDLDGQIKKVTDIVESSSFHSAALTEPKLEVVNLGFTHKFGGIFNKEGAKIQGLCLTLHEGQCLGVIGESGSGKSTLAQMLVGLLIPDQGCVKLNGREIDFSHVKDIRFLRSKIQLVMQDGRGSLHPNKTIRWLFEEVIDQRKKEDKNLRFDFRNILNEVGLSEQVLDRQESSLSGGECLRISIARALLMHPEILICDESTTSLDEPTRDGIMSLLLSLMQKQKLALILISHDDSMIRQIANDILVLAGGEVIETGKAALVMNNPEHPITKKIFAAQATLSQKRNL